MTPKETLAALGLDAGEIRLCAQLMKGGTATAGELAKRTGIKRQTVYDVLKKLRAKGIVTQGLQGGVRAFRIEGEQRLRHLFAQQGAAAQETQNAFLSLVASFASRRKDSCAPPKMTVFEGVDELKNILNDFLMYTPFTR